MVDFVYFFNGLISALNSITPTGLAALALFVVLSVILFGKESK